MKDSDISILIPTLSRPEFLLKNLNFLVKLNANFNICICDSSPNIKSNFTKKLNKLSEKINIKYFHKPSLNDREAIFFLIENCKTEYSAYLGDDDFFIPNGLTNCADFLSKNLDYRVVYGKAILVDGQSISKPNLRIKASNYWGCRSYQDSNSEQRLDNLSKNYHVNLFGVHRTKEFLKDFRPSSISPSKSMSEILVNYLTIAKGKGKFLTVTYLIRQAHQSRYQMSENLIDILIDDNFAESIPLFISELTNALNSQKFNKQKAMTISKKHLKKILQRYYSNKKQPKINDIARQVFKRVNNSLKNRIFLRSSYYYGFKTYLKIISNI